MPALRQLSTPAAATAERRRRIAEDIRFYLAEGQTVPWYRLTGVYKLPQPELQRILDQEDAAAAERQRTLSARVTRRADETHDAARGRSDWEAVAREVDLPLVDCLRLFDPALSGVPVRSLPAAEIWSTADARAMKAFIASNPEALFRGDWRLVGVYMNVDPADCRMRYRSGSSARMTPGLYKLLSQYRERGFTWGEIHQRYPIYPSEISLVNAFLRYGVKSRTTSGPPKRTRWTQAETKRIEEVVALYSGPSTRLLAVESLVKEFPEKRQKLGVPWTASEAAKLHDLVNSYGQGLIDWAEVAAALGRTVRSCYKKHIRDRHQIADSKLRQADAVDREVQRQRELGPDVDWAAVSRATGLAELECLELCRIDEIKARWTYDPDTFSQQTADRMKAFIAEHYPSPVAPNFRAVSNYMWIDAGDCARMAQLLRGVFEWTPEAKAKLLRLREQGLPFKENIVDENAGKMPYFEIRRLVAEAFRGSPQGSRLVNCMETYATAHPFYKARLEALDKTQIANDILSGAASNAEAGVRALGTVPLAFTKNAAEAPTGRPPLVILHGLFGSKQNWRAISKQLARTLGRDAYSVDQRNHGDSPHQAPHTYAAMSADLVRFIEDHGLGSAVLIGHSMGGKVVMRTALERPDLVAQLVVDDMVPMDCGLCHNFAAYVRKLQEIDSGSVTSQKEADRRLAEVEPDVSVRQFLLTNMKKAKDATGAYRARIPLQLLGDSLDGVMAWDDLPGREYAGPTLFIGGRRSPYVKPPAHPAMRRYFPNCEIAELDTGHWVHAEMPVEFMSLVEAFVSKSER
ncbi:hypothetical protein H4R18_000864 [Coemansia javaensis]|uniref:Myb-like domain-containing protein n=1 Tax=Coemansia javaensis TaxID=2761396 RepID=A0A9W8HIK2_9FUNG|nr:hypothetical protein H4R18_000864 [Coemansia javaensis]